MKKLAPAFLALCAFVIACENTTPSGPPNVAGTYEGNLTVTLKELGSFTYQAEVDIVVILSALGQTLGTVRHVGDISDAGEFTYGSGRADSGLPQCGDVLRSAGTMKFSENNLRWTAISETESCDDLTLEGILTRP